MKNGIRNREANLRMMHCTLDTTTEIKNNFESRNCKESGHTYKEECPKLEEKMARDQEQANVAFSNMCLDDRYSPFFVPDCIAC